jgi:hypothetical protein
MTIIGKYRFGNDYNADKHTINLYKGESIRSSKYGNVGDGKGYILDKIEIRYNARKGWPSYPAMKSLYRWRSVFGYRLGGLLRQGVVKLAEIRRPAINAARFVKALATGKLDQYQKLYSSRHIYKYYQKSNLDKDPHLFKYFAFSDHPELTHINASTEDFSLHTFVGQKIRIRKDRETYKNSLQQENLKIEDDNKKTGANRPLNDIAAKMKEYDTIHSYAADVVNDVKKEAVNTKEQIVYKVSKQVERIKYFFRDARREDLKTAYRKMVERSQDHHDIYVNRFDPGASIIEKRKQERLLDDIVRNENTEHPKGPIIRQLDMERPGSRKPEQSEGPSNIQLGFNIAPKIDDQDEI